MDNKFVIAIEIVNNQICGLCDALFMSEPSSMFTMHWFREYLHAFNPNDYTTESSVQLPLKFTKNIV